MRDLTVLVRKVSNESCEISLYSIGLRELTVLNRPGRLTVLIRLARILDLTVLLSLHVAICCFNILGVHACHCQLGDLFLSLELASRFPWIHHGASAVIIDWLGSGRAANGERQLGYFPDSW